MAGGEVKIFNDAGDVVYTMEYEGCDGLSNVASWIINDLKDEYML